MIERPRCVRVLVVEGQPLLRDLLARLIDQQPGMRAVALCDSARTAIEATERAIDVALIGPHVLGVGGVPLGEALRARSSRLGIVVLAAPESRDRLRHAPAQEVAGWAVLSKNLSLTAPALVYALRSVAAGRSVLDPAIRAESVEWRESPLCRLSARQREVLALVAEGLSNTAIAERLGLSPRSVEAHLRAAYAVLGVGSDSARNARVDAVRAYLAHGGSEPAIAVGEIPLI
ncbi:DNA-binding NarL/FixJ family response regulator [Microbacterium sp. AG790]|nr:DNA-binding NarL/FixJ family response regulator [Microbacterium sp. AG790]